MNCEEAQVLSIPHIMGDLDPCSKQYQELEAHLAICQVCAEEYESSKETVEFIQEHKAEFAEAFEAIDREKAVEQEEIQSCWKRMEAELDRQEAQERQEKEAKFRRLFVKVSAAAACLAIGVFTWIFSDLQFQVDMGILLTFMFLLNMIASITLLPALAALFYRKHA
jgi:cation transport ATPase